MARTSSIALVIAVLSFAGCGKSEIEVSGNVTLADGTPLKDGNIVFEEVDQSKTPAGGSIKEGRYSVRMLAGTKKVKINASRPPKKIDPVMGAAAREEMISKEFNTDTTLRAEITASKSDLDFTVKARP